MKPNAPSPDAELSSTPAMFDLGDWVVDAVGTAVLVAIGLALWMGAGSDVALAIPLLTMLLVFATWSPSAGVAACLIATPTVFYAHALPRGHFTLVEIAIVAACFGFAARTLLERGARALALDARALLSPVEVALPVVAILIIAAITLTTLANPVFGRESLREVRLVIAGPILFLCVARLTWRDDRSRRWSALCLVGSGVVISAISVVQIVLGDGGVSDGLLTRATATYPHPNNLALFLERTTLFTFGVVLFSLRSWWGWSLVVVQALGVVATFSRGALLALLIGSLVLLWWRKSRKSFRLLLAGAVFAGLLLFFLARERLLDAGGAGDEPTRFALWRSSIEMIQNDPMTGVGPDQFLYQYGRRTVEPAAWPERYTAHPHNIVLDIWLRLGMAGIAAFAWLLAGVSREVVRISRMRSLDCLAPGAIVALIGGLTHGLVDNAFFLPDLAVMTWAFVAWLVTARRGAS